MQSKLVIVAFAFACVLLLVQESHGIQQIGKFYLKNSGGFVARARATYFDDDGEKQFTPEGGDITLGFGKVVDLDEAGIPDGAHVTIYVYVMSGKDREGTKKFQYKKGSPVCAKYVITGAIFHNDLGLTEVAKSC